MINQRFGKLVVTGFSGVNKEGRRVWECDCDCGNKVKVRGTSLKSGRTKSCGCFKSESSTKNLIGQRFGRLVVLGKHGVSVHHKAQWKCQCDCGEESIAVSGSLLNGHTKSCGCMNRELVTKHGESHSRLYQEWADMKQRCLNPNNASYHNYGGRGIRVCDEWLDASTFIDWAKVNGYRDDLTIDRVDTNGNYEPSNCRFIPLSDQHENKRTNRIITLNGESDILINHCRKHNKNFNSIRYRLNAGWIPEEAFGYCQRKPRTGELEK